MKKYLFILIILAIICIRATAKEKALVVNNILIGGNKTTKENVIIRELSFKKGDD